MDQKEVIYRSGYKITRRPVLVSIYRDGCLVSRKQKVHTRIGDCGQRIDTPVFHDTYTRCK